VCFVQMKWKTYNMFFSIAVWLLKYGIPFSIGRDLVFLLMHYKKKRHFAGVFKAFCGGFKPLRIVS
jgi:hypothetical protein